LARDAAAVWHPFTQHSLWLDDAPTVVDRAEGPWLFDVDGRRYLDGVSSLWVTTFGHREPEIDAAITAQLAKLDHATFLGATHVPGIELAERLLETAPTAPTAAGPRLSKVFYAGDGSSAVEVALKMAYQHSVQAGGRARPLFVHLREAYHGDTLGAVSVGGIELFHATYRPLLLRTVAVGSPGVRKPGQTPADRAEGRYLWDTDGNRYLDGVSSLWVTVHGHRTPEIDAAIVDQLGRLAAVVVEPLIQAAAGMLVHPPGYLRRVREACDRHDVLLIVDEVATGFGRTGRMLACQAEDVEPDLMTLGKGLTGGYLPLSAVLTSNEVFDAFLGAPDSGRTFYHGHTYTGNPLAAAVALANLDLFEEEDVVGGLPPKIRALADALDELVAPHPAVGEIRHLGMMVGIELVADRVTRTPFALARQVGNRICARAVAHGVVMRPLGDVLVLMPPLAMSVEQLERLVEVTAACIREELG
jgi:adenosylmethionine-8-amino-7-oxononanoate aminotransferase